MEKNVFINAHMEGRRVFKEEEARLRAVFSSGQTRVFVESGKVRHISREQVHHLAQPFSKSSLISQFDTNERSWADPFHAPYFIELFHHHDFSQILWDKEQEIIASEINDPLTVRATISHGLKVHWLELGNDFRFRCDHNLQANRQKCEITHIPEPQT